MNDVIIIDNSPIAYLFQPENALAILSWYDDQHDRQLYNYIPFLIKLSQCDDVRPILNQIHQVSTDDEVNIDYGM